MDLGAHGLPNKYWKGMINNWIVIEEYIDAINEDIDEIWHNLNNGTENNDYKKVDDDNY